MAKNPPELPSLNPEDTEIRPFEKYLDGLPAWQVAALKAGMNWPAGRPVSRTDFKAALKNVLREEIK